MLKSFYRGNLSPFHGNTVILCYTVVIAIEKLVKSFITLAYSGKLEYSGN